VPWALSYWLFSGVYFGDRQGAKREDSQSYLTEEQRSISSKEAAKTVKNLATKALK